MTSSIEPISVPVTVPQASYKVLIGPDALRSCGEWLRRTVGGDVRSVAIVSNPTVFDLYGSTVFDSLRDAGFTLATSLMDDGEEFKSLDSVHRTLADLAGARLTRTDVVLALGGGVVGDLAGFAASVYLRGIPFVQVPTTLLAMVDSSVGGKTGVNTEFGKNLVGSFHHPAGVLVDPLALKTLETREFTAGLCEVIKHGALAGRDQITETKRFLTDFPIDDLSRHFGDTSFIAALSRLISQQIEFKASIVRGDPRESTTRSDGHSRKVLNFGHTLGHALEKVTGYKHFRHGEAVGYGMLFASELSKTLAFCPAEDVELLNDVVHRAGVLPTLADIDIQEVLEAFVFDKKNLNGSLEMVLLKGIGRPVIAADPPLSTVKKVLKDFFRRWSE